MLATKHRADLTEAAARSDHASLFVSLELASAKWLITSAAPGVEKFSKHQVKGGDGPALLDRLGDLRAKAERRIGARVKVVVIQEAGFDGFWIHRLLQKEGIESYVVDPASIAVDRRARRAKTDVIDGVALVRTLMAYVRGEPRVCAMAVAPSPEEEDRRRITRERKRLIVERVQIANRIQGLLATQGVKGYGVLRLDRRRRLEEIVTGDGRALPTNLKAEIVRMLDRLELVLVQIAAVEQQRDALLHPLETNIDTAPAQLARLRAIGPEIAVNIWTEGLYRDFANRKQVAAFSGLSPSPFQSGETDRDQGISKSGNKRLRTTMIELAWLWLRHQPRSALSLWFERRVGAGKGRIRRIIIVALARKLLIALWRYVKFGEVPEGAEFKSA